MTDENAGQNVPTFGASVGRGSGKIIISSVARGSAAWIGGVNVNDEILTIDGVAAEATIDKMTQISSKKVGDVVKVSLMRDGIRHELDVTLTKNENIRLKTSFNPQATAKQLAVRERWMGVK
ncbi:peptidase Do [compost metagenome]